MELWGYGLGGIVVRADSMGRMASFCTVGFYDSMKTFVARCLNCISVVCDKYTLHTSQPAYKGSRKLTLFKGPSPSCICLWL